jgi:adenylate cyclase
VTWRERARRLDGNATLLTAARFLRELLPGDSSFGDPLSTGPGSVEKRLSAMTTKRPGLMREAGLSALQVWQAVSETQGRGRGDQELAIVFTDLVDFSTWALDAGDEKALELLRDVARAIEPPVEEAGGEVVKRLGDGMMAVLDDAPTALDVVYEARERLAKVDIDGYVPRMRAGLHVGRPRRLGGDYLGVDVNIAARLADEARDGEIIVSQAALDHLETVDLDCRRRWRFRVKGVPKDLEMYAVARR